MFQNVVEISDAIGQKVRVQIRLTGGPLGDWKAIDSGRLRHERGVATTGSYPAERVEWVALYDGPQADDIRMVLHLDNYKGIAAINESGEGWLYVGEDLRMKHGKLRWQRIG